jgi:hypothetical protein
MLDHEAVAAWLRSWGRPASGSHPAGDDCLVRSRGASPHEASG